jgi:hypothetical protein
MPFSPVVLDRERDKFVENPAGETSVRVYVGNGVGQDIPVSGNFDVQFSAPTGPFDVTNATVTDAAANPIATPLANRVSLSIRNESNSVTIYFGKNSSVTADNASTGGWEIGAREDFNIDLNDANLFFLITPTGTSAAVKILEIAST